MLHTLIVGAGPFGLTLAAHLTYLGINNLTVGKPMEFWQNNMPEGMFLRSGCDWHLDVNNRYTITEFVKEKGLRLKEVHPIALDFYLKYVRWFIEHTKPKIKPAYITGIQQSSGGFIVTLDDNSTIKTKNVVVAVGFKYFAYTPADIATILPQGYYSHTCNTVDMSAFACKRVLIIGGRQSAFEWAALLHEKDTAQVHVSYRHDTPAFATANWNWVMDVVNNMKEYPTWFRELSAADKETYRYRLWSEGRLKVEPWLDKRVRNNNVTLHPCTQVVKTAINPDHSVKVLLNSGDEFDVDHIITATGYKVEINHLPFLNAPLLQSLVCSNGFPHLDAHFQSNIPGLYFSSFMAAQDFGPFFGFTIGVRTAAQLIASSLLKN